MRKGRDGKEGKGGKGREREGKGEERRERKGKGEGGRAKILSYIISCKSLPEKRHILSRGNIFLFSFVFLFLLIFLGCHLRPPRPPHLPPRTTRGR